MSIKSFSNCIKTIFHIQLALHSLIFFVFRDQLVDCYCAVLHLSSDLRVVFEGKHKCSNSPSV